jgi:hypothetical protein
VLSRRRWHGQVGLEVPDGVRLVFLPPYTPELQPAETLWALVDEPIVNTTSSSASSPAGPKQPKSTGCYRGTGRRIATHPKSLRPPHSRAARTFQQGQRNGAYCLRCLRHADHAADIGSKRAGGVARWAPTCPRGSLPGKFHRVEPAHLL